MSKNVCFMSIFDLTVVHYEMAVRLNASGHQCYWITTNALWTSWLLERGIARSDILELVFTPSDFLHFDIKEEVIAEIVETETVTGCTINLCMLADRFMKQMNYSSLNDYVCLYYYHIKRFLKEKCIDVVFGEPTNINELVTNLLCQQLGIPFLYPQTLRIPDSRFFFGDGVATGKMLSSGQGHHHESADIFIEKFVAKRMQPTYFHLHNRRTLNVRKNLKALLNRLSNHPFSRKHHLTHHHLRARLVSKLRMLFNRIYIQKFYSHDNLNTIPGKIAFFGLHVQPESSIDVQGPYFSDQLKLIKDIRRSLPFDISLVIKEHPNFLGGKPINFYRELRKIPNVWVISPYVSVFDIYQRASLVLTVSGTLAYEAGILGIPAITFANMYFKGFSSVTHCSDITRLTPLVTQLLQGAPLNRDCDIAAMEHLFQMSYPGYWTDPINEPRVMEKSNLDALFAGFQDILDVIPSRKLTDATST